MVSDVAGSLKDRLNSAVFGTFTTYYLVFNWKIFLYLFSTDEVTKTIASIETLYKQEFWFNFWSALGLTVLTLLVIPAVASVYDVFTGWIKYQKLRKLYQYQRNLLREHHGAVNSINELVRLKPFTFGLYNNLQVCLDDIDYMRKLLNSIPRNEDCQKIQSKIKEVQQGIAKFTSAVEKLEEDSRILRDKENKESVD